MMNTPTAAYRVDIWSLRNESAGDVVFALADLFDRTECHEISLVEHGYPVRDLACPVYIVCDDDQRSPVLGFAGLWDAWKDPANGQWLQTFTIITTDANELMAPVHNRMPVIVHPGNFDRWLSRDETHQPPIDLLRPFPAD